MHADRREKGVGVERLKAYLLDTTSSLFMCTCIGCLQKPEEGIGSLGAGVSGHEPLDVGFEF